MARDRCQSRPTVCRRRLSTRRSPSSCLRGLSTLRQPTPRRALRRRRSSRRTASPRGVCASAGARLLLVVGVACEVVAAEPLDGQDPAARAGARPPPRAASTAAARTRGRRSARRGTAGRTGPRTRAGSRRRSGSRPSSCSAGRTDRPHDRETGAALRAVDERVAEPAVGRVEELARQSSQVAMSGGISAPPAAGRALGDDPEASRRRGGSGSAVTASTRASGGASSISAAAKASSPPVALGLDQRRPRRRCRTKPPSRFPGQPVDERAGSRRPGRRRERGTGGALSSASLYPRRSRCGASGRPPYRKVRDPDAGAYRWALGAVANVSEEATACPTSRQA